ncbi:hypothetical protein HOY82DRAFT_476070 [Tuber indicum]|nr:hypothetical protein HOY82DRAFT_476070 [Tuber indicum]
MGIILPALPFTETAPRVSRSASVLVQLHGKALVTAFLTIYHFLLVTILIKVLTGAFAAVTAGSRGAEHWFIVAVNTGLMVKSDSLLPYTAPPNPLGWLLHPLRHARPL